MRILKLFRKRRERPGTARIKELEKELMITRLYVDGYEKLKNGYFAHLKEAAEILENFFRTAGTGTGYLLKVSPPALAAVRKLQQKIDGRLDALAREAVDEAVRVAVDIVENELMDGIARSKNGRKQEKR